jgi:hypothetical protein
MCCIRLEVWYQESEWISFCLPWSIQTGSGVHSTYSTICIEECFSMVKRSERDANHSPPSSVEFKNAWTYTFPLMLSRCGVSETTATNSSCDVVIHLLLMAGVFGCGLDDRIIVFRFHAEARVTFQTIQTVVGPTLFTLPFSVGVSERGWNLHRLPRLRVWSVILPLPLYALM